MRNLPQRGLSVLVATLCVLGAAGRLGGQTSTWTGAGADKNYASPGNWAGNVAPANNGTVTIDFNYSGPPQTINLNSAANILGIGFAGNPGSFTQYDFNAGGGSLTIGGGGISVSGGNGEVLFADTPVVLSASQTWNSANGFIDISGGISESGGSRALTLGNGTLYMFTSSNTFSGGLTIDSGSYLSIGGNQNGTASATIGTGALTLQSGSQVQSWYYDAALPNAVSLGSSVTIGVAGETGQFPTLTLSGPITALTTSTTLNVNANATLILSGSITGPTTLSIVGLGSMLINDGGSLAVLSGSMNQVSGINISGAQVILAPTGNPATSYSSVSPTGLVVGSGGPGYLGLDGNFTQSGAVSGFLSTFGAGIGASINGSLGFDTYVNPGSPNTFNDPVDLSAFSSESFLGIGSSTYAILGPSALITPPASGPYAGTYLFGGGGGTLVVKSPLADGSMSYGLTMTYAPEPVTVLLQGATTYTGTTNVNNGVLIFDSAVPTGGIYLQGGYAGYTEMAGNIANAQAFVDQVDGAYPGSVIGFDSTDPASPRTIPDSIDLSAAFNSDDNPYLGTATTVTLGGTITPAAGTYQFTGVKGGQLTVASQLTGAENSVVIGLQNPLEANGSVSSVALTNANNDYGAGTTLYSGILSITDGGALGLSSGPISVPDPMGVNVAPALTPATGSGSVTVANAISVGELYSSSGPGLALGNTDGEDMLTVSGNIGDGSGPGQLAIEGPVALTGTNSYSGGTVMAGTGNAELFVNNPASLGAATGPLMVTQSYGTLVPLANVALANPIVLGGGNTLTIGSYDNSFLITLNGVISDSTDQGTGYLMIDSNAVLNGINTFSGGTTVNDATVTVGNASALGTGPVALYNSAIQYGFTNPTLTDLTGDYTSSIALPTASTLTLYADTSQSEWIYSGAIGGDGTVSLVASGPGIQVLNGTATYGGGTMISQGVLVAGSSGALGTGAVTVAAGAQLGAGAGATITNSVTLSSGSGLVGAGTFSLPGLGAAGVVIGSGTSVMPGIAVPGQYTATLSFRTPVTFAPGGIYVFNLANASGVAGTDYGTLAISGGLSITALPTSQFTIDLVSIGSGTPGPANFSSATPFTWTLATSTGITGFSASDFTINASGFQNSLAGGSLFVTQNGNALDLNFTPVPEPSTWVLMMAGLAAVAGASRRSRRFPGKEGAI